MVASWWYKNVSAHNEGKSVIAERFTRTFNKIHKYMTSVSKKCMYSWHG